MEPETNDNASDQKIAVDSTNILLQSLNVSFNKNKWFREFLVIGLYHAYLANIEDKQTLPKQ